MTVKRWVALVLAVILLVGTGLTNMIITKSNEALKEMVVGDKKYGNEVTLEPGSIDKRIAVLEVDGTIQGDVTSFTKGYNHKAFLAQVEAIKNDKTVKAVVLKVNSPGGGVIESAEMYKKLTALQTDNELPIYVSMGAMAASGGYYIAAPANKIYAIPETITGSIGVIMQTVNYEELAKKVGIRYENFQSGVHKDMLSPTREVTAEERAMMQEMINESYETFVGIVADGRGMPVDEVKKVADGRILSGNQAKKAGLVDEIADFDGVIADVRKDFDLKDAAVIGYDKEDETLRSLLGMRVASLFGPTMEERFLQQVLASNHAPQMMYLYGQ